MNISSKLRRQLNAEVQQYCGWHEPQELRPLWDTLSNKYGIDILLTGYGDSNGAGSRSWEINYDINGEPVDNSMFVFSMYEGNYSTTKNEYNMYFS